MPHGCRTESSPCDPNGPTASSDWWPVVRRRPFVGASSAAAADRPWGEVAECDRHVSACGAALSAMPQRELESVLGVASSVALERRSMHDSAADDPTAEGVPDGTEKILPI